MFPTLLLYHVFPHLNIANFKKMRHRGVFPRRIPAAFSPANLPRGRKNVFPSAPISAIIGADQYENEGGTRTVDIFEEIRLEDCPYCGGAGLLEEENDWCWYVMCMDCG